MFFTKIFRRLIFIVAVTVGTAHAGLSYHNTDPNSWTAASVPSASAFTSVAYGNGKFVAVGSTGSNRVRYSTDGINWTLAAVHEANIWLSVTYGAGKFVAVSADGTNRVMYSTDAITWTAAAAAEANPWRSVTYGAGKFVAVSSSGTNRVMHSTDGVTWTAGSAAEANLWQSVTYGAGKFVAVSVGGANQVMHTTPLSFTEAAANNGSIDNSTPLTITLSDETFTGANGSNLVAAGKVTLGNIPAGLTPLLTKVSNTELELTLTANATAHQDADDVSDITFAFSNTAFTGADASVVTDSGSSTPYSSYVGVDFADNATPLLSEVVPVVPLSSDPTPTLTLSSTIAGSLTLAGSCSSGTVSPAALMASTATAITFTTLADGTYADCDVTITDLLGATDTLRLSQFVIDTTPPGAGSLDTSGYPTTDLSQSIVGSCGASAANGSVVVTTTPSNGFVTQYNSSITLDANGDFTIADPVWSEGNWSVEIACLDEVGNGPTISGFAPLVVSSAVGYSNVFDPPSAQKIVNVAGWPEIEWKMVWINDGNTNAFNVVVEDPLDGNVSYVTGTLMCDARGVSTTTRCEYDAVTHTVYWEGSIGSDVGGTSESDSDNEVVIVFNTTVASGLLEVENQAIGYWDHNGNGSVEMNESILSDDPALSGNQDPTRAKQPVDVPTIGEWARAALVAMMLATAFSLLYRRRETA